MRRSRGMLGLATLALGAAAAAACGSRGQSREGAGVADGGASPTDATLAPVVLPDAASFPSPVAYDGASGVAPVARIPVSAEVVSSRTNVQEVMFAAGEMQISGEPFAEFFAGRDLNDYDRTYLPPDEYLLDEGVTTPTPVKDLFGFSTAVESYEYSKMHMNMIANQTTAGLSLANGPIVTATQPGATSLARLVARSAQLLTSAGTNVAGYAQLPAPTGNASNYLGFTGLWPNFAPFSDFDPTLAPATDVVSSCTFAGGYGGIPTLGSELPEFECAYNTLHLPNRDAQVTKTLVPAAIGFATWKEAIWSIDFSGRIHDSQSIQVTSVAAADRALVGTANNTVVALDPGASVGTFLGSTPLEDMWGLFMLDEMDNVDELLWSQLTTSDGTTLGGFASRATATSYDYTSPLRWFPAAIGVTEDETVVPYPAIASFAISDATSRSVDLAALLLGNAMFFGETDPRNAGVGQRIGLLLTFDGDPFPADDGVADGESTAHDRTLAILRVAFVDLDRMHTASLTGGGAVTVDTATVTGGVPIRGPLVTTTSLAHVIIGLRQTLLSVNGAISQYGAADPSPTADLQGILNPLPIHPPQADAGAPPSFSTRVRQLITSDVQFVHDVLTKSDGTVANGATIDAQGNVTLDPGATTLDNQAAAARALTEAFLITGDASYQTRARAVATRLQTAFYSPTARMYRWTAAGADDVVMTPELFAWLQSALRETYKSLSVTADPSLGRDVLADRIARVNKLFLNGWDDLDGDQNVDHGNADGGGGNECLGARLQLGEQALTGELGRNNFGQPTTDRDSDCVLEIDASKTGSLLAAQVHFHSP